MAANGGGAAAAGRGAPFDASRPDEAPCGEHLPGSCLRAGMTAVLTGGTTDGMIGETTGEMTGETTGMSGHGLLCVGILR